MDTNKYKMVSKVEPRATQVRYSIFLPLKKKNSFHTWTFDFHSRLLMMILMKIQIQMKMKIQNSTPMWIPILAYRRLWVFYLYIIVNTYMYNWIDEFIWRKYYMIVSQCLKS